MLSKLEKDFSETRHKKLLSLEPLTTAEISRTIPTYDNVISVLGQRDIYFMLLGCKEFL